MTEHILRRATLDDCVSVARNARPADCIEFRDLGYRDMHDAMLHARATDPEMLAGLVNGAPICVWGCTTLDALAQEGRPWMISTPGVERHAALFARVSRDVMSGWQSTHRALSNFVHPDNRRAIRWLRWLGFRVDDTTQPFGRLSRPFLRFQWEAEDV